MKYMNKSIEEIHLALKNGEVTSKELIDEALANAHLAQDKYNAFVTIIDAAKEESVTDYLLSGIPYAAKDLYSTKDVLTTGSSNTLKDYIPFFNATAIENLTKNGAVNIGKTVCDEFGMGAYGNTGHTGSVLNPWDTARSCRGSSAGSACAVAAGVIPYALGTDTGDSIRHPAAYCGIVGYKPTYGMISRYGVLPYSSSLDHCGVLARSVKDCAIVVDAMKGLDPKDMTTWDSSNIHLYASLNGCVKGKKLCYIKELCDIENYPHASEELKQHLSNFKDVLEKIKTLGITIEEVSIDKKLLTAISSVYNVIAYSEATSNLSNMTGIVFGPRSEGDSYAEMMKNFRTKNFSPLIKRRFIIGSYVLQKENKDRYFINAQRARRVIVDVWNKLYEKYDGVILPVGSNGPAKYLDMSKNVNDETLVPLEEHLQVGNFGGFPSITIPDGFVSDLPVALNITGKCYDDENVLNIAYAIEKMLGYEGQIAKEVK